MKIHSQRPTLDLSVILVNWNTRDLLVKCLASLYTTISGLNFDVWLVDNASTDDSIGIVRDKFPAVKIIANTANVGFACANNQAMAQSTGRYMLLLNTDAVVTPGAIQSLASLADSQPRAGIVGAQLLNTDGSFQASHSPFPTLKQEFLILSGLGRLWFGRWYPSRGPEADKGPQAVDYVEGACLLVRREAYTQVGGMDEGYFMYAEEVDWCYAMKRAVWQVWYQPQAKIIHHGGGSSRNRRPQREGNLYRSRVRFFRKHYGNEPAQLLKLQIFGLTTIKIIGHGLLRLISGGYYGRPVVSLRDLMTKLRGV